MPEPFKNLFSRSFFETFSGILGHFLRDFNREDFIDNIFDKSWEKLELKQRARHTSLVLNRFLSGNFEKDVLVLTDIIDYIQEKKNLKPGIESMFIPDYIEVYGIEYPDVSLRAMERITRFFSCEFSIRPFILRYPDLTLQRMQEWSKDPHPQVRRLSTEGCRPRLPWAMAIPFLKKDPDPILPILETLKNDESETVRRSVANNLNDISKDNPEVVIKLARKWLGTSEEADWVAKHGCRTLLKQAHPEALELFGYGSTDKISTKDFKVLTPSVPLGESLVFSFHIKNRAKEPLLIRLEYGMYYLKANGKQSKKVFKISERQFAAGESRLIERKQSFQAISTRKYYPGPHRVSVIVNGQETDPVEFEVIQS